jgi:hypothetical protein
MIKRTISLLLIIAAIATLLIGCSMPKSVTINEVKFSVNNQSYDFLITLKDLIYKTGITCSEAGSTMKLSPGTTKEVDCVFKVNNVDHAFKVTLWNNTNRNIKLSEGIIKEVCIHDDGISANQAISIMGANLDGNHQSFKKYFGEYSSKVNNSNSYVYTWKNIPIKDANYLITVIVTESFNDLSHETKEIRVMLSPNQ